MKYFQHFLLHTVLLLGVVAVSLPAQAQCYNATAVGSVSLPTAILGTATIFCNTAQSYGTWQNAVNGSTYVFNSSIATDYLTIRSGAPNGPVVAMGPVPLAYTPSANGTLYVHVNTNAACGTSTACRDITATRHNPCTGSFSNGTATLPTTEGSAAFISSQQDGLYSTWNSAVTGSTYIFASSTNTSYLTIRSGTPNGPVVAVGTQPLTYTATANGTLYVHLNTNSNCGYQNTGISISATRQPPACANVNASGTATLPTANDGTATIANQLAGDYGTWSSAVAGSTYVFASSRPTDYLTIRSGSYAGPVVAVGMQPVPYTPLASGTLYVHVNAGSACGGTDFYSRNITATKQAPGCGNVFGYAVETLPAVAGTSASTTYYSAGEYGTWNSAEAGKYYVFSSSIRTDYLTIRRGSPDGQLVASGVQPVACMAGVAGPLFVYVNTNSSCGTANGNRTITATNQFPGCVNMTAFGTAALPLNVNGSAAISNQQATQYGTWTGAVAEAGRKYSFSSSVTTDYLTIRQGSPTGPVVAYGQQPVLYSVIADGTLYVHVNTNASCGTQSSNRTITATNQSTACTSSTLLGTASLPTASGGSASFNGVRPGTHYMIWNGAVANGVYAFTSTKAGDYLTIRTGSATGPAVAVGTQPISYTAAAAGTLYVHVSSNASCSSSTDTSTITVTNQSQACSATTAFGTAALPAAYAGTASIANQQAGQYGTWSNALAGKYYVFTSSVATDYLTVRSGSPNGPVVAAGTQPVTYLSTTSGTLYVHVHANAACGTQATGRTITAANQPPVCTNTTYNGERTLSPVTGGIVSGYQDQAGRNYAWVGAVVGTTYTFSSNVSTDYLTVTRGYANGPVAAAGTQPVAYTATTAETLYVHLHSDPFCGTAYVVNRTLSATTQFPECTNTVALGAAILPVNGGATATITNQQAGQYGTWNNAVAGRSYKFSSSVTTDYMTVRSGSPNGPVLISGRQPLTGTATVAGPLYVHVNSDYNCGAQATSRTITATRIINYCIPSATSVHDNGIVNVTFGIAPNIVNNTTAYEPTTGQYGNYSNLMGDMPIGIPTPVSITFQTTPVPYSFAIYMDLNDDGDFTDAGETVASGGVPTNIFPFTQTASVTIPSGTVTGQRRMRIAAGANGAPASCQTGGAYQCFEDYTVNIVSGGACAGVPVAGTAAAPAPIAYCGTAPAKMLSLNGFTTGPADIGIQWQSSADSISFTDIPNATGTSYTTPSAAATRYYRAAVTCSTSSQSATSNVLTITVNPNPTVSASTSTAIVCGGGSAILTGSGADTYNWVPGLLTGSSVTVSPLSTTTYIVTGTSAVGCTDTGIVTVTTGPNITLAPTAAPSILCEGGSTQLNAGLVVGGNNGNFTIGAYQLYGITGGPFYKSACANYKVQHIYTAAELSAAGLVAGTINSITWYVTGYPWGNPIPSFRISMANISDSSYTANTSPFVNGAAQVYSTSSYQPVAGANTFTFSTPFVWDGTSNVLVQVCHDYACSGAASVQMTNTGSMARVLATENNAAGCAATAGNYKFNSRPVITFGATTPSPTLTYSWTPAATLSNAAAANPAAAPVANTTYTVQATSAEGCQLSGTVSVTVRTAGQWMGTTSTDWSNAANWCGGVPAATSDVLVPGGASVLYMPAISGSGSANNITLQSGASLAVPAGAVLNLYGNITGPGTLNAGAGTVNLAGAGAQTMMPGLAINTLSVNGGSTKSLSGNVQVNTALNLTNGMIDVGSNTLSLSAGAVINGASSSSYVRTSGTGGRLRQQVGSIPVTFPVGNSTYNPVTLTNNGTVDQFSAGVRDEVLNGGIAGAPISPATTYAVNRTWDIEEATPGGSNVNLRLQWDAGHTNNPAFDYSHVYISHFYGGGWDRDPAYPNVNSAPAATGYPGGGPYTAQRNGVLSFSPFTISSAGSSVPLPVKLISLTASNAGARNKVAWESATEQGLDAYYLQHATDGKSFTDMAKVAAVGRAWSYSFYDDAPAHGLTYYRLRIADADGSSTYSGIVKALQTISGETSVVVAPNPVQDVLTVSVTGGSDGDVQLTDVAGRVVATAKVDQGYAEVDTRMLPAGTYFLVWTNGVTSRTFIVSKR